MKGGTWHFDDGFADELVQCFLSPRNLQLFPCWDAWLEAGAFAENNSLIKLYFLKICFYLGHLQMPCNDRIQNDQQQNAEKAQTFSAHFVIVVEREQWLMAKQFPIVEFASSPVKTVSFFGFSFRWFDKFRAFCLELECHRGMEQKGGQQGKSNFDEYSVFDAEQTTSMGQGFSDEEKSVKSYFLNSFNLLLNYSNIL